MTHIWDRVLAIPAPFNMVIVIVALIMAASVVTSIAKQIRKYACLRHELDFKRDMIDRGMTVDEIERLVKTRSANELDET